MDFAHDLHGAARRLLRTAQRTWDAYLARLQSSEGPTYIAYLVLGLVVVGLVLPPFMALAGVALVVAFVALWVREFVALMSRPDAAFPGRYDKLVWSVLLLVLPPVGLAAFWWYRRNHDDLTRAPHGPDVAGKPPRSADDWF